MLKKIWLLLVSLFGILFLWTTFANPIAPGQMKRISPHYKITPMIIEKENTKNQIIEFWFSRIIAIIIETIILFVLAKLFRKQDQISNWKLILFWILPTTITLPFLRFVLPLIIEKWLWYTIIWELLVTIIEAIILKYWLKISRWKAITASIVCNAVSYGMWLLIL